MQNQFQLVFTGKILDGFSPEHVRANAERQLRLSPANLEALFSGRRAVLKRGLDFETGDRARQKYAALGMKVHLEPLAPEAQETGELMSIMPPLTQMPPELQLPPNPKPKKVGKHEPAKTVMAPIAPPSKSAPEGEPVIVPAPIPAKPIPANPVPASAATPAAASSAPPPSESQPAPEEICCPKCNTRQPKRTLCRSCGMDMPRYFESIAKAEREARQMRLEEAKKGINRLRPRAKKESTRKRIILPPDEPQVVQPPLAGFGWRGRLSRTRYLVVCCALVTVMCFAVMLTYELGFAAFLLGLALVLYQGGRAMVLRLHDAGYSAWFALLGLIPLLGLLAVLGLLIPPSVSAKNQHGAPPTAASLPLELGSFIVMAVVLALMLSQQKKHDPFATGFYQPQPSLLAQASVRSICSTTPAYEIGNTTLTEDA